MSSSPEPTRPVASVVACWLEPHCESSVVAATSMRQALREPGQARDVEGLLADLRDAAAEHLADRLRRDAAAVERRLLHGAEQVGGVHSREPSAALADRTSHRLDDVDFAHRWIPFVKARAALYTPAPGLPQASPLPSRCGPDRRWVSSRPHRRRGVARQALMADQDGTSDGHSDESHGPATGRPVKRLDSVVIRFAGDSGDGMQLTGTEFTRTAALYGNDIATFPDFPAEIRAPAGSLAGVSGFQLQFSSNEIFTAGDAPDVLVAMNPAALRRTCPTSSAAGMLIVNIGAFKAKNLELAGYTSNPLEDGSLAGVPRGADRLRQARDRGAARLGPVDEGGLAHAELLRARPAVLALRPRAGARDRLDPQEVHQEPRVRRSEREGVRGRLQPGRDARAVRVDLQRAAREARARAATGTSPATRRRRSGWSPRASSRTCRCSTRAIRSRPRPTCCTTWPATRATACRRSRPRTRSPRSRPRSARRSAARSASRAPPVRASR